MALGGSLAGTAKVLLTADTSNFDRGMRDAHTRFGRHVNDFGRESERLSRGVLSASGAFSHLGRSIAFASSTFLGGAGLTYALKASIGAASDLHEQLNKTDVVFRSSAREVKAWSEQSASGFGLARGEALKFASTFGNLLVPMGVARDKAADMSKGLVQLSADLASFNNADPTAVLEALQSGLAGQVRPLRQYGIFLDQTRIKAEAFNLGLLKGSVDQRKVAESTSALEIAQAKLGEAQKKYGPGTTQFAAATLAVQKAHDALAKSLSGTTGQLTAQQKALATYSIILKDSKDAQGDFARTSGGLANQQRILHAEIVNLEEGIGKALLPTVLNLVKHLTGWLGQTKNQERVQRDFKETLSAVAGVAKTVLSGFKLLSGALGGTKNAVVGLGVAFVAFKTTTSVLGLVGLAKNVGLIGSTANIASGEVKGLRLALMTLGSPATLAALTVGGLALGAYLLYRDAASKKNLGASSGQGGTAGNVIEQNGKFYIVSPQNAGRGGPGGMREITPAQAKALTGTGGTAGGADRSNHPGIQGAGSGILWSGDHSGLKSSFKQSLGACVADAGGTQVNVTSGRRSSSQNATVGGASNSNHLTGSAADGTCVINRVRYPLGNAPMNYAAFGLRAGSTFTWGGAPDIYHVDDGSNVGGAGAGAGAGAGTSLVVGTVPKKPPSAASLAAKRNALAAPGIDAALDKQIGVTDISGSVYQIGALQSGFTTQAVKIPGIGKILTQVSLTPTVQAWQQVAADLKKKFAAATARLKAWQRSLAKAKKAKFPNKGVISHINQQIAKVKKVLAAIRTDLGIALSEINQLGVDATAEVQKLADEAEGAADVLPYSIQQALADASLTESTADDLTALGQADVYYTGILAAGTIGGLTLTPDARLAVTTALANIRQQEQSLAAQSAAGASGDGGTQAVADSIAAAVAPDPGQIIDAIQQRNAFLSGIRDLRGFEDNILKSQLGGSTISVTNYFPTAPTDPHTFSAGLQFELQALVG